MSLKLKIDKENKLFYCTVTCYDWIPLFEITKLYDHIYGWFDYLQSKGNRIISFVIMPNHLHLILFLLEENTDIHKVIGNGKRFMAYEIVKRLRQMDDETVLSKLKGSVPLNEKQKGKLHNVFEPSFDVKVISSDKFLIQKMNYIHCNPVRGKWNLIKDYRLFEHSSAGLYEVENYNGYPVTHYMDANKE